MLVYFDPWIAGVVLPGFIIVGLCAIPYLDTNPKGNGYYTFEERPFAWAFFWVAPERGGVGVGEGDALGDRQRPDRHGVAVVDVHHHAVLVNLAPVLAAVGHLAA